MTGVIHIGVFVYAVLVAFVSSAMSMNRRENRGHPTAVTVTGWGLFSFSATVSALLFAHAAAMAAGIVGEDSIVLPF